MSDFNAKNNRVVWFDIPVGDLDRADKFYASVLDIPIHRQQLGDLSFSVLHHTDGNGGCLVVKPAEVSATGTLNYLNTEGRIRDAVAKVTAGGGQVLEDVHSIGPHGFRAVILDSEGNRLALHSSVDA